MATIKFEETGGDKKLTYLASEKEINLTHTESQRMFHRMVEKGHFGIFMADVNGYLFYVNHAFVDMLGYEHKDDILGVNLADMLFKDKKIRDDFLNKLNKTGLVRDYELDFVRKDGIDSTLSIVANFSENENGEVVGIDGIVHDVTDKNNLEEALLTEKQKLEQILDFSETVGAIKEFDELAHCIVERTAKMLEAQKCSLMILDQKTKMLSIAAARGLNKEVVKEAKIKMGDLVAGVVAQEGQPLLVKNIEYDRRFCRANRSTYKSRSFMIAPVKFEDKVLGVINVSDKIIKNNLNKGSKLNYEEAFSSNDLRILHTIAREVSVALDNVQHFKELNSLVVTDPLVHIYNYRQFSKSLEYEIKRCRRSDIPLSIIMIDIDDFKSYNDTFGHPEGDALLRSLGKIFEGQLREVDIVCRYAGDEFTIILPHTDVTGAKRAAEKVQEAVANFSFKRKVTLSIGIAGYKDDITQYQLILNVDKALYKAKREGKNRICVFE